MSYRVELKMDDLGYVIAALRRALDRTVNLTSFETWGNIMEYSPQDHGRLAGSWQIIKENQREYLIYTNVEYAAIQNFGGTTGPHIIRARNARALRFVIGGQVIFRRSVKHPGSKIPGKHYIERSTDDAMSRLDEFIARALREEGLN